MGEFPKYVNTFVVKSAEDHLLIEFYYHLPSIGTNPKDVHHIGSFVMSPSVFAQFCGQLRLLDNENKKRKSE